MSRTATRLTLAPMLAWSALVARPRRRVAQPRRILVAHQLLLGDTLMLAGLLAKLRQNHPDAEIIMTCPPAMLPLFAARPYGVIAQPYAERDAATLRALWRHRGFDLAIVPAENRMAWLARALGARHIVGFAGDDKGYKNWLVDERRPWPATPTALVETFAQLADGVEPPGFTPEQWPLAAARPFDAPGGRYAVLHLGASTKLKRWDSAHWRTLADALAAQGITPVWSAGAKELELVAAADPDGNYTSYAGRLDLLQMAHLLRNAALLICPDTGIAHLGRIVNVPTVVLFGPGSALLCGPGEFWRDAPYVALTADIECRDQRILFRRQIEWVRRCGRGFGTGPGQCPRARCMEALTLESVKIAYQDLLRRIPTSFR